MNKKALSAMLWVSSVIWVGAQQAFPESSAPENDASGKSGARASELQVSARGPHHRDWSAITWATNRFGVVTARTNAAYTELGAGLHYRTNGQWAESNPNFVLREDGWAVANQCQHQVTVSPNLNTTGSVVDLITPEGGHLRSAIVGLNLFDPASGKSRQIAVLKNSIGQLSAPNEITFFDAFSGLKADVRLKNEIGGFHQEVLLREKLTPEQLARLGFDADSVRLETWTEFLESPAPRIESSILRAETDATLRTQMVEPDTVDQLLDFGTLKMARGKTFVEGKQGGSAAVFKEWMHLDGKTYLVEAATYAELQPLMAKLPASTIAGIDGMGSSGRLLAARTPPLRKSASKPGKIQIAKLEMPDARAGVPPVVMDYVLSGSLTNFTFQGDTTYYLTNSVDLYGTTTIEGGTVVKFGVGAGRITIHEAKIVCKGGPYRPATFTAKDDDSIGSAISGSTGTPTNYNYGDAQGAVSFVPSGNSTNTLCGLRLWNLCMAISIEGGGYYNFYDLQSIHCRTSFNQPWGLINFKLYNALFYNDNTCFSFPIASSGPWINCQNVTVHNCGAFTVPQDGYTFEDNYDLYIVSVVNSLFAGTDISESASTNFTAVLASDAGVFQTVGAASHYLAGNSVYRNAGTTNIDSNLLVALRQKTTYPPIVISNQLISAATNLGIQAYRDVDLPDYGYHYDPLDYAFKFVRITNSVVRFQAGTAIGAYGPYGLATLSGSQLISDGAPTNLNHFARYNMVQECSNTNWVGAGDLVDGNWMGGAVNPLVSLRFSDCSISAQDGCHFKFISDTTLYAATDCQFHGGKFNFGGFNFCLTNNLIERASLIISDGASDLYPVVRNCLFIGGGLIMEDSSETPWIFRDNLFDHTSLPTNAIPGLDADYNGYAVGSDRLYYTTNSHDVVTNLVCQTGPLGSYYQTNTSAFSNRGSTTANLVGLYHYTTQTNQLIEAGSTLDIGFHYVALEEGGGPVDLDGNGIGDFGEDANSNGIPDSIETEMGYNPFQTNALGTTQSGYGLFMAEPKGNSQLP